MYTETLTCDQLNNRVSMLPRKCVRRTRMSSRLMVSQMDRGHGRWPLLYSGGGGDIKFSCI